MDTRHHDQTASVHVAFVNDVRSLVAVIDELGNLFEQESEELIARHTNECAGSLAVENVRKIEMMGKEQFQIFITERLFDRTKTIYNVIPCKKLKISESAIPKTSEDFRQE